MTLPSDNRLTDAPMTPVGAGAARPEVLARKSSWDQTSIQWDAAASAGCLERNDAKRLADYGGHGMFLACSALSASITDAVRHGELPIVDETLPATT